MKVVTRRAFAFIELLVVIGVIALLIGILVPTLARAKENALRASCLSNLRVVKDALNHYANQYAGRVPIGYHVTRQCNQLIWNHRDRQFQVFGWIHRSGVLADPSALFCPAETDARFLQGTEQNPWPPGEGVTASRSTVAGYGMRPETPLPDESWPQPSPRTATTRPLSVPRITDFKEQAIIADLSDCMARLDSRHWRGVNVLYADGAARFIRRDVIEPMLVGVREPELPPDPTMPVTRPAASTQPYLGEFDDAMLSLWKRFDER